MVAASNGGAAAAASNEARRKGRKFRRAAADTAGAERLSSGRPRHPYLHALSVTLGQKTVRRYYLNPTVQWVIAGLIMGNFATNVVEKQIDPWNTNYGTETWYLIETSWNVVFIIELLWNIYGCFYIRHARVPRAYRARRARRAASPAPLPPASVSGRASPHATQRAPPHPRARRSPSAVRCAGTL